MSDFLPLKLTDKQRTQLETLGLFTLEGLLNYFPYRYELIEESDLGLAKQGDKLCFTAKIVSPVTTAFFRNHLKRSAFKVEVKDNIYQAIIFNRQWINKLEGRTLTFFGSFNEQDQLLITNYNTQTLEEQKGLQPYYRQSADITNNQIKTLVRKALDYYDLSDRLPKYLIEKYDFLSLEESYRQIHQPSDNKSLEKAKERLKYQELFFFNLQLLALKTKQKVGKPAKNFSRDKINDFIDNLPFKLKDSQVKASEEILDDLAEEKTMLRLLQGEVGSGKTVIAAIAMYACALVGYQSVMLAPTEILAKQHYDSLNVFLPAEPLILLSSAIKADELKETLRKIAQGEVKLIVGTHRLFQDDVRYNKLGLVIADEQQRFGVSQRQKLIDKGENIDVLQMSATPIPRTIALSLYADMDVSILEESVYSRQKIITTFINENSFFSIKNEIEDLLDAGNLCYVVCASIAGENTQARNIAAVIDNLKEHYGDRYRISALHSQMKEEDQASVMKDFSAKRANILVCTSIIEVGIDVPDANLLIVYDADRFGLSQLHQLRGRVGRRDKPGYCYLLSATKDEETVARLQFVAVHNDGQTIARYDFQRRGFGDITGIRQSGKQFFQLIDVEKDLSLIESCYQDAKSYLKQAKTDDPLLLKILNDSIIKN